MFNSLLYSNIDMYRNCFDIIASELDNRSVYRFCMKLKVPEGVIEEPSKYDIDYYERIHKILDSWKMQAGQQADIREVIKVLQEMGKNAIADKVIARLRPH